LDDLLLCCRSFSQLASSCTYYFVVAARGKKYSINIQFEQEQFIHLTGISGHLHDLPIARESSGFLIKEIEEGRLTLDHLKKSQFFCCNEIDIAARIKCVAKLDDFLRSENTVIDYYGRSDPRSRIQADWLVRGEIDGNRCYLFLVSKMKHKQTVDRSNGDYVCSSMFPEKGIVYGSQGRVMTTLHKRRNSMEGKISEIIYVHPKYQDSV